MMTDSLWIRLVDHRISIAIILFVLLILLGRGSRRERYPLHLITSFVLLCSVSWFCGFLADILFTVQGRGLMESIRFILLSLLFFFCHKLCCHVSHTEAVYTGLLAVTIYKAAWNTFKSLASALALVGVDSPWSFYSPAGAMVSYVVYFSVVLLFYLVVRRYIKDPPGRRERSPIIPLALIFLVFQMVLEYCGQVFAADSRGMFLYYLCALMYTLLNYVALMMMALLFAARHDNDDMRRFINNKMQYYQMSHDGIASLQAKCHDLKHQVALIRSQEGKASFNQYLDALEDSINGYSTVIDCGYEAANIVLTEKNILCQSCGIRFSYMLDGSLLSFLSEKDLYSLLGNALDNAVEAARKVEPADRRYVTVKSGRRSGMVFIHVENSFDGSLSVQKGRLRTTKQGAGHGFGYRSICEIAEKYNGTATFQTDDDVFRLMILLAPSNESSSC